MRTPTDRPDDSDADSAHHEEEDEEEDEEDEEEEEEEGEEEDEEDEEDGGEENDEEDEEEEDVWRGSLMDEVEEDPLETAVHQLAQDVVTTEWADDELTAKLNMIAEALEEAEAAFRKDRTPPYRREGNLIGNLLQVLDQQDEFYAVLESKLGELTDARVQAAVCRVLLATVPVHSRLIVRLLYEEETLDRMCEYAADAAPPLRCYATGLLAVGLRDRSIADIVVNKEASIKFLQRIKLYASKMERERQQATKYIHERLKSHKKRALSFSGSSHPVRTQPPSVVTQRTISGLKRKFSETTMRTDGDLESVSLDDASGDGGSSQNVTEDPEEDDALVIQSAGAAAILQFQPDPERHEEELKRLVMLELLYTLDCIGLMGEYMELFAPALKEDIIGTILTFLHSPNPTVLSHAMKLTSHFLAHKKFCFLMLDAGGIDLLLATATAMHGTNQIGVLDQSLSMCLHGIASSTAVMEKVLALDAADTLLLVAFRLLTSANDRARQNAVVFFGLTLVFKGVLEYFEKEQGVYHLLNIIRVGNTPKSAVQRQLSHDACLCLRQYLRVHMALVTHRLRRRLALLSNPTNRSTTSTGTPVLTAASALSRLPVRVPKLQASKPLDIDDKAHEQNLVFYEKYQFSVPGSGTTTPWSAASGAGGTLWAPAGKLSHLRGPLVMLEVIARMVALVQNGEPEDTATAVRVWIVERAQFCLECLRVLTLVVPSLANDVCSTEVCLDEGSGAQQKLVGLSILLELAMSSNTRDSALVRDALHVFCNCVSPPHAEECWQHPHKDIRQFTLTARGMRRSQQIQPSSNSSPLVVEEESVVTCCPRVKDDKAQRPVRKLARAKNAIKVCVQLLRYKRSVQNADAIRLLATRALLGLSRDRHIAQILEKMQLGQLLSDLIRQDPVLEENADLHVRFRESALDLISLVTHRAPNAVINEATDPTVRKIEKASIVAQTPITYDPNELLGLIHSHLVAKGLTETAAALVRESHMETDVASSASLFKTPEKAARPRHKHGAVRANPIDISTFTRHQDTDGPRPSKISKFVLNPIETTTAAKSQIEEVSTGEPSARISPSAAIKLPHGERRKRVRRAFRTPHLFGSTLQLLRSQKATTPSDPTPKHGPPRTTTTTTTTTTVDAFDRKPERSRLDEIITHYLREQHRQCANPVTTVPPFKLLGAVHRCPDPSTLIKTPVNICSRLFERSRSSFRMGPRALAASAYADAGVNRYVFSRYRPQRIIGNYSTTPHWGPSVVRFYGDAQRELLMGNHDGNVRRIHMDSDAVLNEWTCHATSSVVADLESNASTRMAQANRLLLTGSVALTSFGISEVAVWDVNSMQTARWRFAGALSPRFNHYGDRIVALDARLGDDLQDMEGDRLVVGAVVLDLATGTVLSELKDSVQSNDYGKDTNCSFAPNDSTILTGGMLWDARVPTRALYKFDKLSNIGYGFFHPNGNEVLINSAVWDLRTYQLLRMVPALDKCTVRFNGSGSVLFAYSPHSVGGDGDSDGDARRRPKAKTWFRVLDARDYKDISTVELQRPLYDLAVDAKSTVLATVEGRYLDAASSSDDDPACRLYEIGRKKPSEDDSDMEEGQGENGSEAMDEDEFDNESEEEEEEEDEEDEEDEEEDEEDEEDDDEDEEMEEEYESDEYDGEEGDEDDGVSGSGEEEGDDDDAQDEQDDEPGAGPTLTAHDIQMLFELPQGDYFAIHDDFSGDEEDDDE